MPKTRSREYSEYAYEAVELLGKLVRAARLESKMPVAELAEKAEVSRGLVQRVEAGSMGCEIGVVFELAALVGVKLFEESELAQISKHLRQIDDRLTLLPERARY